MKRSALILTAALGLAASLPAAPRVVIITPHAGTIRHEFTRGFTAWYERAHRTTPVVEWRDVGGTSDALKFVRSEFKKKPEGIGIDLFFGGGLEPYLQLADDQLAVPYRPPDELLKGIPAEISGMSIYDREYRWFGSALSAFGILQNLQVQRLAGLPMARRWEELAQPELLGMVGAGDPRKSGTMNAMFEAFLQAKGWSNGWNLLARIGGNARKFDALSTYTAKDVTLGETAYGFAIDFYAFPQIAMAGRTNLTFVLPEDFTAVNPDGICLLRGAPNAEAARRFLDFTLSEAGQKLWFLPRGHPEGPQTYSIERMSVRPDLYARYKDVSNIAFSPFALRQGFLYDNKLARNRREVVSGLVGALLVDTHPELHRAWQAIIRRGLRPADLAALGTTPITGEEALRLAAGPWQKPAFRNHQQIAWQDWARAKYRRLAAGPASGPP